MQQTRLVEAVTGRKFRERLHGGLQIRLERLHVLLEPRKRKCAHRRAVRGQAQRLEHGGNVAARLEARAQRPNLVLEVGAIERGRLLDQRQARNLLDGLPEQRQRLTWPGGQTRGGHRALAALVLGAARLLLKQPQADFGRRFRRQGRPVVRPLTGNRGEASGGHAVRPEHPLAVGGARGGNHRKREAGQSGRARGGEQRVAVRDVGHRALEGGDPHSVVIGCGRHHRADDGNRILQRRVPGQGVQRGVGRLHPLAVAPEEMELVHGGRSLPRRLSRGGLPCGARCNRIHSREECTSKRPGTCFRNVIFSQSRSHGHRAQ
ncbi:MAG: hypothetical protein FJX76_18425 [Armatimonadetes bacterium]|nr:hypothetical protein [Armatimonadota bacterium]